MAESTRRSFSICSRVSISALSVSRGPRPFLSAHAISAFPSILSSSARAQSARIYVVFGLSIGFLFFSAGAATGSAGAGSVAGALMPHLPTIRKGGGVGRVDGDSPGFFFSRAAHAGTLAFAAFTRAAMYGGSSRTRTPDLSVRASMNAWPRARISLSRWS